MKIGRARERIKEDEDNHILSYIKYIEEKIRIVDQQEEELRSEVEGQRLRNEVIRDKINRHKLRA